MLNIDCIIWFKRNQITFERLKGRKISKHSIYDTNKDKFSIFFIDVFANLREVKKWEHDSISKSILRFCKTKKAMTYYELEEQIKACDDQIAKDEKHIQEEENEMKIFEKILAPTNLALFEKILLK